MIEGNAVGDSVRRDELAGRWVALNQRVDAACESSGRDPGDRRRDHQDVSGQ
jgi:hypothetical protein